MLTLHARQEPTTDGDLLKHAPETKRKDTVFYKDAGLTEEAFRIPWHHRGRPVSRKRVTFNCFPYAVEWHPTVTERMGLSQPPMRWRHYEALKLVQTGADVYSRALAVTLREVKRIRPDLIDICGPRMYEGDGTDRMPYFGAIVTRKGRKAVRQFEKVGVI